MFIQGKLKRQQDYLESILSTLSGLVHPNDASANAKGTSILGSNEHKGAQLSSRLDVSLHPDVAVINLNKQSFIRRRHFENNAANYNGQILSEPVHPANYNRQIVPEPVHDSQNFQSPKVPVGLCSDNLRSENQSLACSQGLRLEAQAPYHNIESAKTLSEASMLHSFDSPPEVIQGLRLEAQAPYHNIESAKTLSEASMLHSFDSPPEVIQSRHLPPALEDKRSGLSVSSGDLVSDGINVDVQEDSPVRERVLNTAKCDRLSADGTRTCASDNAQNLSELHPAGSDSSAIDHQTGNTAAMVQDSQRRPFQTVGPDT